MDRYVDLERQAESHEPLTTLRKEFDRQLAPLRDPGASAKLRRAFAATPRRLAKAANRRRR